MNPEQAAAFVIAQAACANAEIAAMQAANAQCARRGDAQTYDEKHFMAVIDQYGISHNAVLTTFQHANR